MNTAKCVRGLWKFGKSVLTNCSSHVEVLKVGVVHGKAFIMHVDIWRFGSDLASSPGHSQILSRSLGEKSGEGLVPLLRHGPEVVDSILT